MHRGQAMGPSDTSPCSSPDPGLCMYSSENAANVRIVNVMGAHSVDTFVQIASVRAPVAVHGGVRGVEEGSHHEAPGVRAV